MKKKTIALALLCGILIAAAASCGSEETKPAENTASAGTESAVEKEPDVLDFLPAGLDFEGRELVIYSCSPYGTSYGNEVSVLTGEYEAGDIVADAVYRRNVKVEDRLNVKLTDFFPENCNTHWEIITDDLYKTVMSGDGAYDAACASITEMYRAALSGCLANLLDVSSVDVTHSWWDQKQNAAMTLGKVQLFTLCGDINFLDNYATSAIFMNTSLVRKNDMTVPYEDVKAGTWTFEKMQGMLHNFFTDLDGDSKSTITDMYGFAANFGIVRRALSGLSATQIVLDAEGWPVVNDSERIESAVAMLADGIVNDRGFFNGHGDGKYAEIFFDGRCLMMEDNFSALVAAREQMEDDLTILPYPKYDEAQESYLSPINDCYCTVYGILTTADAETVGYVLEAMGAASVDTVTEEVINKNCMVKAVRDEDTADMIRVILNGNSYPLELICNWGDIQSLANTVGNTGKNNYMTQLAKKSAKVQAAIDADMELFRNPEN